MMYALYKILIEGVFILPIHFDGYYGNNTV